MSYVVKMDDIEYKVKVKELEANKFEVHIDDKSYVVDARLTEGSVYSLLINNESFEADVDYKGENNYNVLTEGDLFKINVIDEMKAKLIQRRGGTAAEGKQIIKSEMPGRVISVKVAVGDTVKEGDILLILEAMKMQNEIKAPKNGEVKELFVKEGENIAADSKLVVIE
ncbi:biotin/lipoyl-containing protein [Desulfurella sp.]|uniref:biotin/lipoyl-containing protein n=1 Tax=Desulfurella sp. TaxID=1962857 RepID=UPI0025C5D015|nr:biotin/lipoyl-containing protein [Desulfurella sp.]